jgi:carboxylesterase type B
MGQTISTENADRYTIEIPNQGILTGFTLKNPANNKPVLHRFAKVPYAKPCKRFALPEPISDDFNYTGEYKNFGFKCPQPAYESKQLKYQTGESTEYIQYNNIWIPASNKFKPKDGWPVLIYIHGGWLQYGDPNHDYYNSVELMDDEHFIEKYIFVTPGYRLNLFGFLTCDELINEDFKNTNMGFWDQRESIEWTYKYIKYFGGNPEKITVSGLSAGSYSTFFQLSYELYHPEIKQIIKQVIFFSNMIFAQPKSIDECKEQYDEIIDKLNIKHLSSSDQLAKIRSLDYKFLETFIPGMELHTFRAVTDDNFISSKILKDIKSGEFSKMLINKKVRIMHGEVDNEGYLYSLLNPPISFEDLKTQIENYYPKKVALRLLDIYEVKEKINLSDPDYKEQFAKIFGQIIADGQVYVSTRGFINNIIKGGFPAKDYYRYRVSFRGKFLDEHLDPSLKVTHAYDKPIWFYALRLGFNDEETKFLKEFVNPFLKFVNFGQDIDNWETSDHTKFRWFKADGSISYESDPDWESSIKIADEIYKVQLKE